MELSTSAAGLYLSRIHRWDVFGTLTFAGKVPRHRTMFRHVLQHLEDVARCAGLRFSKIIWAFRVERGEQGGRLHVHYLAGDLELSNPLAFCYRLENMWKRQTGGARVEIRPFNRSLSGPAYVSKCLSVGLNNANTFEVQKFGLAESVTISAGVVRILEHDFRRTG